jgi:hypothetical protein
MTSPGSQTEAWKPGAVLKADSRRAADPLRSRQAAAQAVADDRLHNFGSGRSIAQHAAALAGAPVADGDRPGIEEIAADRDLVAAVVVPLGMVGL